MKLYQCVKCTKLFENYLQLYEVKMDSNSGYYICDDCIRERIIETSKDLNSTEVLN